MLTNKKRHKLSLEILITVAVCFATALCLFLFISVFIPRLVEEYCFNNNIILNDYEFYKLDAVTFGTGVTVSVIFFIILFFSVFGKKLTYIRTIIKGIADLQNGNYGNQVEILGNNELTQLAEAVNYLSASEAAVKKKEKQLSTEKEELIRTLSHDIRTPLTSIMSYTELLLTKENLTDKEQKDYMLLVNKKMTQIKDLTDILLDGSKRSLEHFDDIRLLFEQLTAEFTDELEENFNVSLSLKIRPETKGNFDTGELFRIFDNLTSNIKKYALPSAPVVLSVLSADKGIVIHQRNTIKKDNQPTESYRMGLNSIRRIAHNYGGTAETAESNGQFEIIITLSDI